MNDEDTVVDIDRACPVTRCRTEPPSPLAPSRAFSGFVAHSTGMRRLLHTLGHLAPTNITVTFVGEAGTGKSLLAYAVHRASQQAGQPFVVLDCTDTQTDAHLPAPLRDKTVYPSARYAEAMEAARGGTLFIDEVAELSANLQLGLAHALARHETTSSAGQRAQACEVRVLAASRRDLEAEVELGRFRKDLYYRLAAAIMRVPALRERKSDIAELLPRLLKDLERPDIAVDPRVVAWISGQPWPGNVRELREVLGSAVAADSQSLIGVRSLRAVPRRADHGTVERLPLAGIPLDQLERAAIEQTLNSNGGNKTLAARALGIAVSTLYEKLKCYNPD